MPGKKLIIRASTIPTSLETFCKDTLRELSKNYEVIALSSPGKDLETIGKREGVRTVAIEMQRHISPLKDIVSLIKLIRLMKKERPWLVHSMTPKAGLLCMIASKFARVPNRIHTFTGLIWPTAKGIKQLILIFADKVLCYCATHIIPEGEGVKRDLARMRITRKPLHILANGNVRGIDLAHYQRNTEVMQKAEKIVNRDLFTFIFVGRIVKDKGITELIEAFIKLHSTRQASRLLLVGHLEQDLDPLPKETITTIETHPAIEAVGKKDDIRPWMAAADTLVFPSYREGFPNVVIEAGAMGLPSIVTDINGSNEIIINRQNGIIIPPHNSDALYLAMKEMLDNKPLRNELAAKSRDLAAKRYDCKIVRKALYDFYASL